MVWVSFRPLPFLGGGGVGGGVCTVLPCLSSLFLSSVPLPQQSLLSVWLSVRIDELDSGMEWK